MYANFRLLPSLQEMAKLHRDWTIYGLASGIAQKPNKPLAKFHHWLETEEIVGDIFAYLKLPYLRSSEIIDLIYLIARQWDRGVILNWFNNGNEAISHCGMSEEQLLFLSEEVLKTNESEAKFQFAVSLYKVSDKERAIKLANKFAKDSSEQVRNSALKSLSKLQGVIEIKTY